MYLIFKFSPTTDHSQSGYKMQQIGGEINLLSCILSQLDLGSSLYIICFNIVQCIAMNYQTPGLAIVGIGISALYICTCILEKCFSYSLSLLLLRDKISIKLGVI